MIKKIKKVLEDFIEEFEDKLYLTAEEGIILKNKDLTRLIKKYNLYGKVKIKAKKGIIVIEKINKGFKG